MIKVLLVAGTVPPNPCGVGDYTVKLAQSLAATGKIEPAILTGSSQGNGAVSAEISLFPTLESWTIDRFVQLLAVLKRWRPDIIHVQYPTQGYGKGLLPYVIPLIARLHGMKSVQTWHEGFGRSHAIKLALQQLASSRVIIVRSNFLERVHPSLRKFVKRCRPILIENASAIPRAACSEAELLSEKHKYLGHQERLIVFFGFLYPPKGVEQLFQIADPRTDKIVIAGTGERNSPYVAELRSLADREEWVGKVTFTGFMPPVDVATLLKAADAVILPFRDGGGRWNTSVHGAILNDALVITTSLTESGYDDANNVYSAKPDDVEEMRAALARYAGRRPGGKETSPNNDGDWAAIALKHYAIYADLVCKQQAQQSSC